MQFQVPQFIETEDKIVGPLSLRQFIYVGVGVGIAAILYFILQTWIWVILAFIFVGGSVALAFVKVEGRPLVNVVVSAFNFYWHPQTYVWQPEHQVQQKAKEEPVKKPETGTLQKIAEGMALHKSWQHVQTGEKISDKEFTERKMYGRYQILQKVSGERREAKRVDYR
jgi:hypothetical protein